MKELLEIARRPAICARPGSSVLDVCEAMMAEHVGAVAIVEDGRLVGILSERDIVARVVLPRRDPATTAVREVMTTAVRTATDGMTIDQAVEVMHRGKFRHLPLVDGGGRVVGMLSVAHLLRQRVEDLDLQNADLVTFLSADGPGG